MASKKKGKKSSRSKSKAKSRAKSRAKSGQKSGPESREHDEGGAESAGEAGDAEEAVGKKAKGKKKRDRKRSAKESNTEDAAPKRAPKVGAKKSVEGTPVEAPEEAPAEADLEGVDSPTEPYEVDDDADGPVDVDALVAEASEGAPPAPGPEEPEDTEADDLQVLGPEAHPPEEAEIEDLDAVLDEEELDSAESIDELIAAAVAGAHEDDEEDEPAEPEPVDLDDTDPGEAVPSLAEAPRDQADEPAAVDERPESVEAPGEPTEGESPEETDPASPSELVSTPEARDRLLAQALAHSEMQDARYRVPYAGQRRAARWKGMVAAVILLIAAVVAASPPRWVRPEAPVSLTPVQRLRGLREALLLQAEQIEAYRVEYQRLPDRLEELPSRLEGLRYVKSGSRAYQLIAYERDGNAIVYDSSAPAPQFRAAALNWLREDGS